MTDKILIMFTGNAEKLGNLIDTFDAELYSATKWTKKEQKLSANETKRLLENMENAINSKLN